MAQRIQLTDQSHFDMFDLFQQRVSSDQLQKFIHLLSHQFNSSKPYDNFQEFSKTFIEVEIFKFETQNSGVASLICALQGKNITKCRPATENRSQDEQTKKQIQELESIFDNFTTNRIGNPVSDIKNNVLKILGMGKIVEQYVLNDRNTKDINELFNQFIINHESQDEIKNNIRKLSIRSINKSAITSLRQAKLQHKLGNNQRYFYCYFKTQFQDSNIFWLICLQSRHKAKIIETKASQVIVIEQEQSEIIEIEDEYEKQNENDRCYINKDYYQNQYEVYDFSQNQIQHKSQNQSKNQQENTKQNQKNQLKQNQQKIIIYNQNEYQNESQNLSQKQIYIQNQNQNENQSQNQNQNQNSNIKQSENKSDTEKEYEIENKMEGQNQNQIESQTENKKESQNENENENQNQKQQGNDHNKQQQIFIDQKCDSQQKDQQITQFKIIQVDTIKQPILQPPQLAVHLNQKYQTWNFTNFGVDMELITWILVIISLALISRYVNKIQPFHVGFADKN